MGKADMSRDYYADLELKPTADLAEIKKQFKKLALKWHPDRNPGRETEVNAKFQTIQSAHEVLTDEVERRRYDAGRRITSTRFSASTFTTTGGTRGNPYANAGAQWAPPPKPFGTPRGATAGPSGADRYQKFTGEGSFRAAPNRPQDQETKKNNYEAFERMKKAHPTGTFAKNGSYTRWQPNGSPKVPDPKYTPQSGREESNNQKHAPPPKPARPGYTEWNDGGMHGRQSPKKSGFMPGNPGGDEPPAPSASSAYFNARSTRASTARSSMAPEPPQPPPRSSAFEKFRESNEPIDGGARRSTPYATQGGEKTNPNPLETSNIQRSKTTRERPKASGYSSAWESHKANSPSGSNKPRSASPPRSRNFDGPAPYFDAAVESPPKRNHSHINTSSPTSGPGSKNRGTPRSNARFQASAVSDTSSDDEDSDFPINNHPSSKKLPRRKVPAQNEANKVPRSNVTNDQYRKPNLAEFRDLYSSGDPLLNKLRSESAGNRNGSNGASQPMYEQGSYRPPLFHNISSPPSSSFLHPQCQRQGQQPFSKVHPMSEELKNETAQDRINKPRKARFMSNERSSAAENPGSSPYSPRHTSTTSSPMSRADDLSTFEQSIMGGLHRTFTAVNADGTRSAAWDTGRGRGQNILFGQSTQLGSGGSGLPFGYIVPTHPGCSNLAHEAASSGNRSPKRKIGVYDSNVDNPTGIPRKIADFYDGLKDSQSNSTNPINNRFPSAYMSQPSANPPLFTANKPESINTTFETGKWDGQFRAASMFNPTEFTSGAPRSQAASRNGRRSPIKSRATGRTRSASASVHSDSQSATLEQPQSSQPMDSPVSKAFAPEEWSNPNLFQPSTFAPPTPRASSKPPAFIRTPSRKGSRAKAANVTKTAGGNAAVVDDDSSDSDVAPFVRPKANVNGNTSTAQTGAASPNAMDIDPPDEISGDTSTAREARNVPVEPMRPEWRATNGNAPSKFNLDGHDDFKACFDDLRNTEPIFQPAHGLNSVNDLKSSLPFKSTASATVPLKPEAVKYPTKLQIPNPPLAPQVPSRPKDGAQRMSLGSWQSYLVAFKAYLTDYQLYDEKIEAHFRARQDGGKDNNGMLREKVGWVWLEDNSDNLFESKIAEIKQDALVREKWADAAKGHVAAMEEFREVRAAVQKLDD